MAIYFFLNLKIPFVGFASPFFLVARLRKFAKKKKKKKKKKTLAGTYYYLNMAISQFFSLEIWQLSSLFSTKTLCMSPTGFVSGHQVTIISHKKREENAHLISHVLFC
jgi:hypothetical protein